MDQGGYKGIKGDTENQGSEYKGINVDARGSRCIQRFHGDTRGSSGLQGDRGGYKRIKGDQRNLKQNQGDYDFIQIGLKSG